MLSPPPLEPGQSLVSHKQLAPQPGQQNRQYSVGYNLQHEFETLTADLDLDLTHPMKSGLLLSNARTTAPSSKYSFSSDFLGSNNNQPNSQPLHRLLRETISPVPTHTNSQGISSILASSWGTNPSINAPVPERPQSVNEFSMSNDNQPQNIQQNSASSFFQDLLMFTNWIENLSPQDNLKMIEYLCNNLPLDILLSFKSKLDTHLLHRQTQPQILQQYYSQQDLNYEMDLLNLNDKQLHSQPQLLQPKPKQNNLRNQYLFQDPKNRPKSADPNLNNNMIKYDQFDRARSPTSHLYEKTNFLQLAAANSNSPMNLPGNNVSSSNTTSNTNNHPLLSQFNPQSSQGNSNSEESLDISAHAALKLGALATINSRVALDSNRKHGHHPNYNYHQQKPIINYEESINRAGNSSSVPLVRQSAPNNAAKQAPKMPSSKAKSPEQKRSSSNPSSSPTTSNSSMPAEVTNLELLNNIPAWLKLLRLHKYTDCLKDIPWRELIELDNDQLEERGVVALGARRKLLKAFDVVKSSDL
jgi:hypothetical protein